MEKHYIFIIAGVIVLVFIVLFGRRIRGKYGTLRASARADRDFQQYRCNELLTYYTSGSDECPTALMGIGRDFNLESELWKKKTFAGGEFKKVIQAMQQRVASVEQQLQGFEIFDRHGQYVGDWYSIMGIHTMVANRGQRGMVISPPPDDLYERHGGGRE